MTDQESKDNLKLWDDVKTPDPSYTKGFTGAGGFSGTSVNGVYTVRQLTEYFGKIGSGWGYEIIEDDFHNGHTVFNEQGDSVGLVSVHTLKINFWYMEAGEKKSFQQYGHTPFITYSRKFKSMSTDMEYAKKSLTDAISKAASLLGFNADVFMGKFDDRDYLQEVVDDYDIKESDDKVQTAIDQRQEYEKLFKDNLALIKTAVSMNELEKVFASIVRKSKRRGDDDGIRKLTDAKDKRKKELAEKDKK